MLNGRCLGNVIAPKATKKIDPEVNHRYFGRWFQSSIKKRALEEDKKLINVVKLTEIIKTSRLPISNYRKPGAEVWGGSFPKVKASRALRP